MGLKNYFKREPVWASMVSLAATSWVGTWLVTRGLLSNTQASSLTQAVAPAVAAGVLLAAGLLLREVVSPVWAKVEPAVESWVGEKMPAELPAVKAVAADVSAAFAEAERYGATVPVEDGVDLGLAAEGPMPQDGPVDPPQEAREATIPGAPMPSVPPVESINSEMGQIDVSPAKPMSAGAPVDEPLPGAGVTVSGQLTAELGGLV